MALIIVPTFCHESRPGSRADGASAGSYRRITISTELNAANDEEIIPAGAFRIQVKIHGVIAAGEDEDLLGSSHELLILNYDNRGQPVFTIPRILLSLNVQFVVQSKHVRILPMHLGHDANRPDRVLRNLGHYGLFEQRADPLVVPVDHYAKCKNGYPLLGGLAPENGYSEDVACFFSNDYFGVFILSRVDRIRGFTDTFFGSFGPRLTVWGTHERRNRFAVFIFVGLPALRWVNS